MKDLLVQALVYGIISMHELNSKVISVARTISFTPLCHAMRKTVCRVSDLCILKPVFQLQRLTGPFDCYH